MKKSEIKEVERIAQGLEFGLDKGYAARGLSGLIRAARTNKSRDALLQYADTFGVRNHPEFII